VDWLSRKLFGRFSECHAGCKIEFFGQAVDPAHPETNNDPSSAPEAEAAQTSAAPEGAHPAPAQRPGGGRRPPPADLPPRRPIYDAPAAAKVRGECGGEKKLIGEEVAEQIECVPAAVFVNEHARLKYACPCRRAGGVQADKPAQSIEKCMAGPGLPPMRLLAHITIAARFIAGRLEPRRRRSRPVTKAPRKILTILQGRGGLLPKSGLGRAIGHALGLWAARTLFLGDGLVEIDNNAGERAIRPLCLGRRDWPRLDGRRGGRAAAAPCSLVQSARRHGLDPFVYPRDLLARIPTHPHRRIREPFPDRWKALAERAAGLGDGGP